MPNNNKPSFFKNYSIVDYNVLSIYGIQHSEPGIYIYTHTQTHTHTHTYIYTHSFFHTIFHHVLCQEIRYSFLCCTVGPHCLSILYVIISISQPQTVPCPLAITGLFSLSMVYFTFIYRIICAIFQIPHISHIIWYLSFSS